MTQNKQTWKTNLDEIFPRYTPELEETEVENPTYSSEDQDNEKTDEETA